MRTHIVPPVPRSPAYTTTHPRSTRIPLTENAEALDGYAGAKDFLVPVTTHAWSDDGRAAAEVINWIADANRSTDPQRKVLGRQAMQGLVTTLTEPSMFNQELDIEGGPFLWSEKDALGQVNPELARALARDASAFLTELSDPGAEFFTSPAKGMSNGEEVNARLFTLIATDPKAAEALAAAIYRRNVDGINDALANPGHLIDQAGRAGQLQGLFDSALHNVALERSGDLEQAKAEADQIRGNALGLVSLFAGKVRVFTHPAIEPVTLADPVDMADMILDRVMTVETDRVDPQRIHTVGVDSTFSGASRLVVRYDMTKALIESGRIKLEDLPAFIRAGDPPRLRSPAEYSSKDYNNIADAYDTASSKVPGVAQLRANYLAEYSERQTKVLIARQAEGKDGLKTKLGIE